MNQYTAGLRHIEFSITYACTGSCKHCSEGDHAGRSEHIDAKIAVKAVREVVGAYNIASLMTFGGEPLLYPETVCAIHAAAKEMEIPRRQLITNGFFSKDGGKIKDVAQKLALCGVNDILLSVDAFHQETIPLEPVMEFAGEIKMRGVLLRAHPAWLVSKDHDNPYNLRTREILAAFESMNVLQSDGNVIFPSGNALKYLRDYFDRDREYGNPYDEDSGNITTVSIELNGDVWNGNVYQTDILEIIGAYRPDP
ncbi:MAG: radical SAM protein [Oscillospiraceae bacterium]|nr:radical SAM protein [Oscillospiraceae bacterium]